MTREELISQGAITPGVVPSRFFNHAGRPVLKIDFVGRREATYRAAHPFRDDRDAIMNPTLEEALAIAREK